MASRIASSSSLRMASSSTIAFKGSALVNPKWLQETMASSNSHNHRILDASWHLPNTGRSGSQEYEKQHIPGALFFDVDESADKSTNLPHMLPSAEVFEKYVGNLGISNNMHVIVYDNNPTFPIFSAQRVWWTFRVFGHDKVSILEGGLQKWIANEGPVTSEIGEKVKPKKFVSKFRPELVKSYDDIANNIVKPQFQLIDARPDGRFKGVAPEPRDDVKPGSIVGSLNIPFFAMLDTNTKQMKKPDDIKKIFAESSVDLEKPIVASCGSGMTACMLALAAYECGYPNLAVYDGSWTEWYLTASDGLKRDVPDKDV